MSSTSPVDYLPNIDPDELHPINIDALAHPDEAITTVSAHRGCL